MNIQTIPDNFDQQEFNQVAHHPLQSWEWGEVRKKTGIAVVRIGQYDQDVLQNVFTMTLHNIPHTSFQVGYIPRSVLPTEALLHFLKEYGKEHNLLFIKFEPDANKDIVNCKLIENCKLKIENFKNSPHPLFPTWTQILDLKPDEDTLLQNMKSKTRYNIRYAARKGVTVREESDDQGFKVFSDLYFQTTNRQEYRGHNRSYHKTVWEGLKNTHAHILIAYHGDEPLAAYELFLFKGKLYYPYGGSSESNRDLMGSNLLMWEAIKFGKKYNATEFDMWGSLPPTYDRDGKWSGFTRFKEGYGTSFVEFVGSYDLVIQPLLYFGYNVVFKIRNMMI